MGRSSEEASWLLIKGMDGVQSETFSLVDFDSFDEMRSALRRASIAAMFSPSPDNVCSIAYMAVAQAMEEAE